MFFYVLRSFFMQFTYAMHERYMTEALKQACKAYVKDEVPVGAIIVNEHGHIIARAYNQVERCHTQTAHAELITLRKAGLKRGDWRLEGCWIYVTLEPCAMCLHALILSRVEGVVYGANSPLFGFHLDKFATLSIYKDKTLPFIMIGGIKLQEAGELLRKFFRKKRVSSERNKKYDDSRSGFKQD